MALKSYQEKRNFQKTSEPKGKKKITGKFRFVVQKHQAQQLHYDFRIEHDGVLVSWAVPKGVPTSSKEKHLAMHVEDHPLEYLNFEGTIPEGEYGAGTVMVWDKGSYTVPKTESRVEFSDRITAGLDKGEIKLFLKGKKLKGLFALVRFKRAGEKAWLFIKDKDYFNNLKVDDEHSVKSGLTMQEITKKFGGKLKTDKNSTIKGKKNFGSKMPESIKPMLATLKDEPFNNKDWLFEPKFDGYRVLAFIENGKARLFSRKGLLMNEKYPEIVKALESYNFNFNAIFDGEVVVADDKGRISFQLLQDYPMNKIGRISYQVFDLLYFKNLDLMKLPLIERKNALVRVLKDSKYVKLVKRVVNGKKLYDSAEKKGYEGIIAKKKDSTYEPGMRSFSWYKIKNTLSDEFIIGGYTHPEGQRKGFGSLLLGIYKNGRLQYAGNTGTGFNQKNISELMAKFKDLAIKKSPFANFQGDKTVAGFVKPELLAQIKYAELTKDGKVRQAVYLGLRSDKKPGELLSESQKNSNASGSFGMISHSDKIYFPEKKYTKLDIAKYYEEISEFILPYLKDRPQNMNRHPDGIHGESFYHKDYEARHPDFVKIFNYHSESTNETISHIVCNNKETLKYLVNLGCIEINPWNSRTNSIEKPDYLVLDLDPDTSFDVVIEVALNLHEILEKYGIPNYVKTSGIKGLHIFVPIEAKYNYEQVRTFAELLGRLVQNELPEVVTMERDPDKRKGKVYIDYLQNRIGQTTVAVYSLRPIKTAAISCPLEWQEMKKGLKITDFTLANMLKRLEKKGDIWKNVLGKGIILDKALARINSLSNL